MQNDLFLVIGLVVLVFTIPAIVSALTNHRAPRYAAISFLIGGGLVAIALTQKPGGYTLQDIPVAFSEVIGFYLR